MKRGSCVHVGPPPIVKVPVPDATRGPVLIRAERRALMEKQLFFGPSPIVKVPVPDATRGPVLSRAERRALMEKRLFFESLEWFSWYLAYGRGK